MLPGMFAPLGLIAGSVGPGPTAWINDGQGLVTFSNANLTFAAGSFTAGALANNSKSAGKWYFEIHMDTYGSGTTVSLGIAGPTYGDPSAILGDTDALSAGWSFGNAASHLYANSAGTNISTGVAGGAAGTIGIAVDIPNKLIYFANNNTWANSAVPSSGTGGVNFVFSGAVVPALYISNNSTVTLRALSGSQTYSPPAGFTAWG